MKKITNQYMHSVNLPMNIDKIQFFPKEYNRDEKYFPVLIKVQGQIYSDTRKNFSQTIDNTYNVKFRRILYEFWLGHFSLVRTEINDSIIYSLLNKKFIVNPDQINILEIDSLDSKEKNYKVKIQLKKDGSNSTYTLPFHQDEFGLWHIGVSKLISPESTVKSFLSEVNNGNTDKARRYFSYGYKLGYDEWDKKNLEELFPKGSIKNVQVSDIASRNDTARLNLTVVKTDLDTFKTDLEFIKLGIEWRFNYNGWDWKFKPANSINMGQSKNE